MKKIFLIITTTNDEWELSRGVIIISAETSEDAIKLLELDSCYEDEEIISIEELKSNCDSILYRANPVVE